MRGFEPPTSSSRTTRANRAALHPEMDVEFIIFQMINHQTKYFTSINPPTNRIVKMMVSMLKYLSMNDFIGSPNFHINPATRKKRADLLIVDAIKKLKRFISNAPAEIVKILYGIGVNPAVKMIKKPC